jgi:hypothetical protein
MAQVMYDLLKNGVALCKGGQVARDEKASAPDRAVGGVTAAASGLSGLGTLLAGGSAPGALPLIDAVGGLVPGAGAAALGTGLSAVGSLGSAFGAGYGAGTLLDNLVGALTGKKASERLSDLMTPSMDELAEGQGMVRVKRRGVAGIDEGNRVAQAHAIAEMRDAVAHQQEIGRDLQLSRAGGMEGAIAHARLRIALGNYAD